MQDELFRSMRLDSEGKGDEIGHRTTRLVFLRAADAGRAMVGHTCFQRNLVKLSRKT